MQTLPRDPLSPESLSMPILPSGCLGIHVCCLDLDFSVWTSLPHSPSVLFLHADDQKLCLWKALAAASWKLTMLRQIEALVLMLTVNDGSLKSPPTALPPSQLTFSCRRPYLKLLIWQVCGAWRGKPRWHTLGLLAVRSCAEYGASWAGESLAEGLWGEDWSVHIL